MKPNRLRNLLKPLYYRMDREIEKMPKVCEKGCYFCCYQPIELLKIEKVILADFITNKLNEETKSIIKKRVLEWLDFFDDNTSDIEPLSANEAFKEFRFRAEKIPIPCPLLINGECSVYKARPITCRAHFVNDSQELCEIDKLRDGSTISLQYRQKIVEELKTTLEVEIILLVYALVEILHIERQTKMIVKSVLR